MFLSFLFLMFFLGYKIALAAKIFCIILFITLLVYGAVLIPFGIAFYKMKYEMNKDHMYIQCGWYKKKLFYNDIIDIVSKDIELNKLISGEGFIKYKKYTLGKTAYIGEGIIYMISTSLDNDVTIITLKNGERYGITPKNKRKFIKYIGDKLV